MKKFNISNSLLNRYQEYKNAELCGLRFKAVNIEKTHSEFTTDAMNRGKWFEFLCTNAKNRDGSEPVPQTTAKGAFTADYQRIFNQKNNFDKIYKRGDKIYDSDLIMEQTIDGQNYKAIFDILEYDKEKKPIAIRDIKMTGVINDKWSEYGWVNITYSKHINQAKFYIWIYWKRTDIILPFYFDVFSTKNDKEFKMFKVKMDLSAIKEFEMYLFEAAKMIYFDIETGFIPYPDLMPCNFCPVRGDCKFFTDMPKIKEINL